MGVCIAAVVASALQSVIAAGGTAVYAKDGHSVLDLPMAEFGRCGYCAREPETYQRETVCLGCRAPLQRRGGG